MITLIVKVVRCLKKNLGKYLKDVGLPLRTKFNALLKHAPIDRVLLEGHGQQVKKRKNYFSCCKQ